MGEVVDKFCFVFLGSLYRVVHAVANKNVKTKQKTDLILN